MPIVYTVTGEPVNVLHYVDAREYVATGCYSWHPPAVEDTDADADTELDVAPLTINEAIATLDPGDVDAWTQGKPRLSALNALLEEKITAEQRDLAWAEYQSADL